MSELVPRESIGNKKALQRIGLAMAMVGLSKLGQTVTCGHLKVQAQHQAGQAIVTLLAWFKGVRVASFRVPIDGRPFEVTGIRTKNISRWLPILMREAGRRRYVAEPIVPTHQLSPTVH